MTPLQEKQKHWWKIAYIVAGLMILSAIIGAML